MMLGDFFTKPLQGSLFRKMRDVVQGIEPITILKTEEELNHEQNSDQVNETKVEKKKRLLSFLRHNKELVGESLKVRFVECGKVKQSNKGTRTK